MNTAAALSPEFVFRLANLLALAGWVALLASPAGARRAPAARRFAGCALPAVLAAVYVALFASQGMGEGGYGSLAEVQRLFANPMLLVAGWLHYLAFDLFVGAWIAEQAGAAGVPHVLLVPLLVLTFLFGPAGLLAWWALRAWRQRRRGPAGAPA
jgi:hypothetical protein